MGWAFPIISGESQKTVAYIRRLSKKQVCVNGPGGHFCIMKCIRIIIFSLLFAGSASSASAQVDTVAHPIDVEYSAVNIFAGIRHRYYGDRVGTGTFLVAGAGYRFGSSTFRRKTE
jgi:hypothetical protein